MQADPDRVRRGTGSAVARLIAAAAGATLALVFAPAALAAPNLMVGFSDNALRHEPARAIPAATGVGASAFRLTLRWSRGERELSALDRAEIDRTLLASLGRFRIVLSVLGRTARDAPQDTGDRTDFCLYVRDALARSPQLRDVVIWNEANKQYFWRPQYDESGSSVAPARYAALLARCWDVLHAFRAGVNLITSTSSRGNDNPNAAANVSHSPGRFVVELGAAYRASGRDLPIFDTVGHHPYGATSRERPWRRHAGTMIAQGDWDKLVQAYHDAFGATRQPIPGRCVEGRCAPIWYMEVGYQTTIADGVARHYAGSENVPDVVPADGPGEPDRPPPDETSPAPDHGTQLVDAIRLAYCQPYVEAYFNFLLRDELQLASWQSGVLWADWSPKPAYGRLAQAVAEVRAGRVDCARMKWSPGSAAAAAGAGASGGGGGGPSASAVFAPPRSDVAILRTVWPKSRRFNWRNEAWRFRVAAAEDATYAARLVSLGRGGRALAAKPSGVLRTMGTMRRAYLTWVRFARRRLKPGQWYRMEVVVTSVANSARSVRLASPRFYVKPPLRRR